MVSFTEITGITSPCTNEDLQKEVERLRIEVELAQRGVSITEEGDEDQISLPP